MKSVYFAFAIILFSSNTVYSEELDFFVPNVNREEVNEQISDKFWNNPFDVPIFLVLIVIAIGMIFFVWKRKWHIHTEE